MATTVYLNFPDPAVGDITGSILPVGESTNPTYPKWIQVLEADFGIENPLTIGSATGGAGTGKVKFDALSVTKYVDSATPKLFQVCATGAHFPTAQLAIVKTGGTQPPTAYLTFVFRMVFVSAQAFTMPAGADRLHEKLTLVYGAVGIKYVPTSPTGVTGTPISQTWSQVTNTPTLDIPGLTDTNIPF